MAKLTKRVVDDIEADPRRPVFVWDDAIAGFGVKALPSGVRRYVLKYRAGGGGRSAQQRWLTLGTHGAITCDQARALAQQALAAVARGLDPQADKVATRTAPTMEDLWERYRVEQLPLKKPSTVKDYVARWRDVIAPAFAKKAVRDVSNSEIDRLHKRLRSTPYQANRCLAQLSRLFNLAEAWGWRSAGSNPCRHVERYREEGRSRYLGPDEIVRLGEALKVLEHEGRLLPQAAAAIRLLLLTGARLNEILGARWEWVDLPNRVINLPDSKTGKKPVFLSEAAVVVLNSLREQSAGPFMVPGRSREFRDGDDGPRPLTNLSTSWRRVVAHANLVGVRIHDLRHTAASIAVGAGATLSLIGRLLGHSQPQTTHRYAHIANEPALTVANQIADAIAGPLGLSSEARREPSVGGQAEKQSVR